MITIVIKDNSVTQEDIQAYIHKEHIEGEYEIITQEEYTRRIKNIPATPLYIYHYRPVPEIILEDNNINERRIKQDKKTQEKLARRYYRRNRL